MINQRGVTLVFTALFFILLILHLVYKWDAFVSFEKLVLIYALSS